jgi:hypothetical protein
LKTTNVGCSFTNSWNPAIYSTSKPLEIPIEVGVSFVFPYRYDITRIVLSQHLILQRAAVISIQKKPSAWE